MYSFRRRLVMATLTPVTAVALFAACSDQSAPVADPAPLVATNALAPCQGDVVTVDDGDPVGCDVIPPQRLDVVMSDRLTTVHDCADMGGSLRPVELVCEGVDY